MSLGDPSILLAEEAIDLIGDIGRLNQHALSAQEMLEDKDKSYAITWFMFNTRSLKSNLILLAFSLDAQERPLSYFQRLADVEPPESYITINDLGTVFDTFRSKFDNLKQAYSKYAEVNRLARVFFVEAETQLKLMSWNLKQAKEA